MKSAIRKIFYLFSLLLSLSISLCLFILFSPTTTLGYEANSTNYKLTGVTTSGLGGIFESTNYSLISNTGQISADPRNYSTSYRINQGPSEAFVAAQPTVKCFETTTNGTTNCTSGPTELLNGGMVAICGATGCYNKARFEIEEYTNPSDTLYTIQISEDNFASDIRCISGSTFMPTSLSNCDINDFRTKEYWENEVFNIKGLDSSTQYYIRISALHGDFTQSDYSSTASATTSLGFVEFDIDIATNSGYTVESSPPYSVSFSGDDKLIPGAGAVTAPNLVWLDLLTNAEGGVAIINEGENGGLYSPTTTETIISSNLDLDGSLAEGFGLQNYYIDYSSSTYLGTITATTNYSGSGNGVGEVLTDPRKVYDASGPINSGRMGLYLKARAAVDRSPATDYSEFITFVSVGRY
jgi:hypothetical protein